MWQAVLYLLGVFVLLVAAHELGHMWVARRFRMKVEEFAIGVGPILLRLWRGRDDALYTIRAFPIGGFVKIAGMMPGEEYLEGSFQSKPLHARALTILAGPVASLLLGFMLLGTVRVGAGVPSYENATLQVRFVSPNTPAHHAGVCIGDIVLKVDNQAIESVEQFEQTIASCVGRIVELQILRDQQQITLYLAIPSSIQRADRISQGIGLEWLFEREYCGFETAVATAGITAIAVPVGVWQGAYWFITGQGDLQDVGSVISIASLLQTTAQLGFWELLELAAMFSLMLGAINLLPIPVLDGGYLLIFLIEALRRRKLSPEAFAWFQLFGLLVVMTLCLGAISLDIYRLYTGAMIR